MSTKRTKRTNRSELDDLTTAQRTAVSEGAVALDNLQGRASFNAWMQVARGIVPLCALADKPGRSRNARRSLFKEAGYGRLSPSNISRLLHMGRLESQIAIWRGGLEPWERDRWNSPATICKKCPDVRKAIEEANKNKPPRPGTRSVSNLLSPALQERDRKIAQLQAYIGELEAARETTSAMTLDQVTQALVVLLQDEPDKALKAAIRRIADKVVAAWKQRRRDGVPFRKSHKPGAIKEVEADRSRALGGD